MQLTANLHLWLSNNKLIPYTLKAASVKRGGFFCYIQNNTYLSEHIITQCNMTKNILYLLILYLLPACSGKQQEQSEPAPQKEDKTELPVLDLASVIDKQMPDTFSPLTAPLHHQICWDFPEIRQCCSPRHYRYLILYICRGSGSCRF